MKTEHCRMTAVDRARLSTLKAINANRLSASRGNKTPRRRWCLYNVQPVSTSPVTDTGAAYIMDTAARMAYTAVRTAYVASGHPYLLKLLQSAPLSIRRRDTRAWWDDNSHDADGETMETMTAERKRHYVNGLLLTGREKELELTEHGRKTSATLRESVHYETMTAFDDLVSEAVKALWDMAEQGVIVNYGDVWQVRRYVYTAVNRYLHSERKTAAETAANEEQAEIIARTLEDKTAAAEMRAALDRNAVDGITIELMARFPKNRETVRAIWQLLASENGYTVREIAEITNKGKSPVSRWIEKIRKFLTEERPDLLRDLLAD